MEITKKQWKDKWNSWPGTRVINKTWKPVDGKPVDVVLHGTVVRSNSNGSQVLVKFDDNNNFESWYGRLGIEFE
jgi:hypothetical protein